MDFKGLFSKPEMHVHVAKKKKSPECSITLAVLVVFKTRFHQYEHISILFEGFFHAFIAVERWQETRGKGEEMENDSKTAPVWFEPGMVQLMVGTSTTKPLNHRGFLIIVWLFHRFCCCRIKQWIKVTFIWRITSLHLANSGVVVLFHR